jgi:hypothetical protein
MANRPRLPARKPHLIATSIFVSDNVVHPKRIRLNCKRKIATTLRDRAKISSHLALSDLRLDCVVPFGMCFV